MSETKKIAILIDCWGEDYLTYPLERQILYKTIDTFLQSGIVDKIIMATYDTGEAIQPKLYNPWIDYTKAYMWYYLSLQILPKGNLTGKMGSVAMKMIEERNFKSEAEIDLAISMAQRCAKNNYYGC